MQVVDSLYDCKSEVIGPGFFRFKAEIGNFLTSFSFFLILFLDIYSFSINFFPQISFILCNTSILTGKQEMHVVSCLLSNML